MTGLDLLSIVWRMKRRPAHFAIWAACLFLLTGCDRSASPSQAAEADQRVVVYTALDREFSEPILLEFTKQTGIRVDCAFDAESTKTVGLVNRIRAEAGRPRCDVFWNNEILNTLRLKAEGLLEPCHPTNAADFPSAFRDPNGYWHGFAARARVLLINDDLIGEGDPPTSVFDLTHERWKGRVGIAKPLFGTTASHVAALRAGLGAERFEKFLSDLRANDVQILSGNKGCAEAVGSGRLAAALTDTDDAIAEIDAGRKVRMIFADNTPNGIGTLVLPNTLALIKGAPNRAAAERLIQFLLSPFVEEKLAAGPSAQIPLNTKCTVRSRAADLGTIRRMDVSFDAATREFEAAAKSVEEILLK